MSVKTHLPSWRNPAERSTVLALVVLSIVSARVDLLSPMFDLDSSWAVGLNYAATHGIHFGHDLVFTYGPLVYLTVPLSMYRLPMLMGIVWAVAMGAAGQTALWILTRRLSSRALRLGLAAAAMLPLGYIWRPEIALLTFTLWILVLLDVGLDDNRNATTWVAGLGALSAVMTLSKFSLLLTFVTLVIFCLAGARPRRLLAFASGGFVGSFLVVWVGTGQNLGDIPRWVGESLSISNGYNTEMSAHWVDSFSGYRIMGLLVAALVLLALVLWRPAVNWWTHRTRANAAALLVIAVVFYFFLKQSFVRFDSMHASAVFGALCILSIAVVPQVRMPAWRIVFPIALVLGTLGQALPPVKGIDTWFVLRHRIDSVRQIGEGLHQVLSADYHRRTLDGDWQNVMRLGNIPVDVIRGRIGNSPVAIEPAHISAAFALGLNWRPMYTLQAYSAFTPALDDRIAAQLTAPDAPEFILARYSIIDNRNQLWTSPRYQLTITCNYDLDTDLDPWMIFRKTANKCGAPVEIGRVTVTKGTVVTTPERPNSIVVATFRYDTGIVDAIASTALRPLINPRVRIDNQQVRIVNGVMSQPHIVSQPRMIGSHPTPWRGITYKEIEFLNVPGDITVTFYEVPVNAG